MSVRQAQAGNGNAPRCKFKAHELVTEINVLVPDEGFTLNDIRNPQPARIQSIFLKLTRIILGDHIDVQKVPDHVLGRPIYPETHASMGCSVLLGLLRGTFSQFHPNLGFQDMQLVDFFQPRRPRNFKFLSNLVNLCVFYRDRMVVVDAADEELKERRDTIQNFRRTIQDYLGQKQNAVVACEERKNEIAQARRDVTAEVAKTRSVVEDNKKARMDLKEREKVLEKTEERVATLENQLKDAVSQKEALEDQCVSSPDKLKAEVEAVRQVLESKSQELKKYWADRETVEDDAKRMGKSLTLKKAAVECVKNAGIASSDAARLKEDDESRARQLQELRRAVQELNLKMDECVHEVEKNKKVLGELRLNGDHQVNAINADALELEEKSIVPMERKVKSVTKELSVTLSKQKELEKSILESKQRIDDLYDGFVVWNKEQFDEFDDKFRMEMMEVTKLISGIEERAQEIQKLNREVMKGKKK